MCVWGLSAVEKLCIDLCIVCLRFVLDISEGSSVKVSLLVSLIEYSFVYSKWSLLITIRLISKNFNY